MKLVTSLLIIIQFLTTKKRINEQPWYTGQWTTYRPNKILGRDKGVAPFSGDKKEKKRGQ
jgi:hypothetical protein